MDAVSLFAVLVFAGSWFFRSRAGAGEPLARLFFSALMVLAAAIGGLGLVLRALQSPAP